MNTQTPEVKKSGMQSGSQMRISAEEQKLIKATYKDRPELLLLLRKIFLPEIDPKAPIGQVIDLWMTVDTKGQTVEQQLINLEARNKLIVHIDQQLMTLELIAKLEAPTAEEIVEKKKKDTNK